MGQPDEMHTALSRAANIQRVTPRKKLNARPTPRATHCLSRCVIIIANTMIMPPHAGTLPTRVCGLMT
jgi:hypothetical protein